MFKKNLSILIVILVLSLVLFNNNVSATSNVFSNNDLQLIEEIFNGLEETTVQDKFVDEIKNEDGSIFATTITETAREIKKDEENGIAYITLKTTQELKYADGTVETKKSIDDISYSKEGEFYINGEKLSMESLKQEYQPTTEVNPTALVSSGGRSWLTYYEIHNNPTEYYYKAFKAPFSSFFLKLDSPSF